jgi:hypothetical protein
MHAVYILHPVSIVLVCFIQNCCYVYTCLEEHNIYTSLQQYWIYTWLEEHKTYTPLQEY